MKRPPKNSETKAAAFFAGVAGLLLLAAGCGAGSGQGVDENGGLLGQSSGTTTPAACGAASPGGAPSGNPNATLDWVQTNVFGNTNLCSLCHVGAAPQAGLNWDTPQKTCGNVGRRSTEIPTLCEIESGSPDTSYVIWKVQGMGPNNEPIQGARMPFGLDPLPAQTIQNMRDWIADGVPGC